MDRGEMIESYGKYINEIKALANYPLLENPTVAKLFENKSLMQRLYKELRADKFDGYLVEYLCYISACFLIDALRRNMPKDASMVDWTVAFIENYGNSRTDVRNLLRLYRECPKFYALLKAEIMDISVEYDELGKLEWGTIREMKERMLSKLALAGFLEPVIYEDQHGKMREDFNELVEFIKVMIRNVQKNLEQSK